ncbi:hypothetical protein OID55_41565 (plasmid) [Streptomyces sp. NBC_00715]|uniref:hypothetical protein n=1 Tax=Streptomyces sp. NBC_00715 TaxID=2975811 RepID=UPI0038689EE5
MVNQQQRRGRVRLAQRRPAPARVRVRAHAAALRGLPWATIGTVVGAVVAIGGLLFTGVATYYSPVVSRQQLDQVKEDRQQEMRAQASRISAWADPDMGKGGTLHVDNRSPDPATDVSVLLDTAEKIRAPVEKWELSLPSLPPCSDVAIRAQDLGMGQVLTWEGRSKEKTLANMSWWAPNLLVFRDADGKQWRRTPEALAEGDIPWNIEFASFDGPPGHSGLRAHVEVKPLDGCA